MVYYVSNHVLRLVCSFLSQIPCCIHQIKLLEYTVQLSSKVTFAHVSDVSHMRSGRTPVWQKRVVALTYVLLQLYREVLCLHGRVSSASQTRPARISDTFGYYLGAELYCMLSLLKCDTLKFKSFFNIDQEE